MDNALRAAVGMGAKTLRANQTSWLKRLPLQSSELPSDQKIKITAGFELPVEDVKIVDKHYQFTSNDVRFLGVGYAFVEHFDPFEIIQEHELITADRFYAIAPQTSLGVLAPLVAPLNIALAKYEINTPLRICHFLAQMYHESDGFNASEEYASGDDYDDRTDLGNTPQIDGDGRLYKGRSFIQITGKYNYQDLSDYLGIDFVSNPEWLALPEYAWLGAGWFWDTRNLNNLADQDDIYNITLRINGGTNGYQDRLDALCRAKEAFGIDHWNTLD